MNRKRIHRTIDDDAFSRQPYYTYTFAYRFPETFILPPTSSLQNSSPHYRAFVLRNFKVFTHLARVYYLLLRRCSLLLLSQHTSSFSLRDVFFCARVYLQLLFRFSDDYRRYMRQHCASNYCSWKSLILLDIHQQIIFQISKMIL